MTRSWLPRRTGARGLVAAIALLLALPPRVMPQEYPVTVPGPPPDRVRTGLTVFLRDPPDVVRGKRLGLITNPASVDAGLHRDVDLLLAQHRFRLVALFGPEHGVRGDQASIVPNGVDPRTGLPVYSLYGPTRKPTPAMLRGIDVLVFDLQDVGARFYTYISTMALAMQEAAARGIPVVVLDRPNPLGGEMVDGPVLDPRWRSFIGLYPLPVLHGMTVGELSQLLNTEDHIGTRLTVVPMEGWHRSMTFADTGLPWVRPSPGIPHVTTALLYPALGPIGDTGLSVGVLTATPFEVVGGTYIQPWRLRDALDRRRIPGVIFREIYWRAEPWLEVGGPEYAGVEVRVTDPRAYRPVDLMLQILDTVRRLYPREFRWGRRSGEGYVFDYDMGTDQVRRGLTAGVSPAQIEREWDPALARFRAIREKYLLYR